MFCDELARLSAEVGDAAVSTIARRLAAEVTVAVHGRAGVGRGCVARGLAAHGVQIVSGAADVDVHVVAEVVKPEDRVAIAASLRPVVVLNKADLSGFSEGGPMTAARSRCARYRSLTGVATVPMVAHLAVAELDDGLLAALRTLVTQGADLGSTDGFLNSGCPLSPDVRARLLHTLDLFGIAHALLALRTNPDADVAAVQQVLRAHSGISGVTEAISVLAAEVRYQRIRVAVGHLQARAVTADADLAARITAFLRHDDTVIAQMAAAVGVVEAAGLVVDPGDDVDTHLCRAAQWQRYARGPVNTVHRACGTDIARGSLRLWQMARDR